MKNKSVLDWEIMKELETFAAKFEQLRNFIDFIHAFVWQEIIDGYEGQTIEKLGCLTEILSDVAHIRDNDLSDVVQKILALHDAEEPDLN